MTQEEEIKAGAETPRYRHLVEKYLVGSGVDIGTGGFSPVVPNAICVDLPEDDFNRYTGGRVPDFPIHLRQSGVLLPFQDGAISFVYASHVVEDWSREAWKVAFSDWYRVLKSGGFLVLLVPEVKLWAEAIARGQPPNCSHWAPEPSVGDLQLVCIPIGFELVKEELTNTYPGDYTILGVFIKP